jgi:hypothetical protein
MAHGPGAPTVIQFFANDTLFTNNQDKQDLAIRKGPKGLVPDLQGASIANCKTTKVTPVLATAKRPCPIFVMRSMLLMCALPF